MRWVKCVGARGDEPGPSARFGHTATCVKSSRFVVVFGGLARGDGDSKGALEDVVVYDARADAWFRPTITTPGTRARISQRMRVSRLIRRYRVRAGRARAVWGRVGARLRRVDVDATVICDDGSA